jgi:AcrR family transcriptional regulator
MIVDAARTVASVSGPAQLSIAALGQELGAPTGSIYYRFKSRDELLASVWMDAVGTFQAALHVEAERSTDPGTLARFVVIWCHEHHTLAKVLTLYRREEWFRDGISEATRARARRLNAPAAELLTDRAAAWFGAATPKAIEVTRLAIVSIPTAAVKDWLRRDIQVPTWVADSVAVAARSVVEEAARCL